jgi:hypothetical protein
MQQELLSLGLEADVPQFLCSYTSEFRAVSFRYRYIKNPFKFILFIGDKLNCFLSLKYKPKGQKLSALQMFALVPKP